MVFSKDGKRPTLVSTHRQVVNALLVCRNAAAIPKDTPALQHPCLRQSQIEAGRTSPDKIHLVSESVTVPSILEDYACTGMKSNLYSNLLCVHVFLSQVGSGWREIQVYRN